MINTNKSPILGFNFPLEAIPGRHNDTRVFYRFSGTKPLEVPHLYLDIPSLYFCVACVIRHGAYHYAYHYD